MSQQYSVHFYRLPDSGTLHVPTPSHAVRFCRTSWRHRVVIVHILAIIVADLGIVVFPGVAAPASTIGSAECCGDCNGDGTVRVAELISMVRDSLGLGLGAACDFQRIGNCGQYPSQTHSSIANLQTAAVRSLRGCDTCPLIFGKRDFDSGCVFRGHVELTNGRRLPAVMRVNEVSVILKLTEAEGGLTILFNETVAVGAPTPTPRRQPGHEFVGQFEIGPRMSFSLRTVAWRSEREELRWRWISKHPVSESNASPQCTIVNACGRCPKEDVNESRPGGTLAKNAISTAEKSEYYLHSRLFFRFFLLIAKNSRH